MTTPINPNNIPYVTTQGGCPPVDLDGLAASAATTARAAGAVRDNGQDAVTAWSAITSCYQGPGDTQIYEALLPVGPQTDVLASGLEQVAAALSEFATEAGPIITELADLKIQSEQLLSDINNFTPYTAHGPLAWAYGLMVKPPGVLTPGGIDPQIGVRIETWDQDQNLVDRNNDLIGQINTQVAAYETVERDCANKINALCQGTQYHPYAADGSGSDDPAAYGYDTLPAEAALPWGSAVDRQESCQEKTVMFIPNMFKGIAAGAGEMAAGIASLDGYSFDSSGVHRSWSTAIQAWNGLNDLAAAVMMPCLPRYDFNASKWVTPIDNISMIADVVTGLVGVHVNLTMQSASIDASAWADDPGTAFGGAVFNIGSFFIPVGGAARGAGATRVASRGAEIAEDIAKSAEIARNAEIAETIARTNNTIKLADLAENIAKDIEINIPEIDTILPENFTRPHIPEPRPDLGPVHDAPPGNHTPGHETEPPPTAGHEPKPVDASDNAAHSSGDPVKHDKAGDRQTTHDPADSRTSDEHANSSGHDTANAGHDASHSPAHDTAGHDTPAHDTTGPDTAADHGDGQPADRRDITHNSPDNLTPTQAANRQLLHDIISDPRVNPAQRAEIQRVLDDPSILDTTAKKGNFAEMLDDAIMARDGWERLGHNQVTSLKQAGHQGIDGIYYKPGEPPEYRVVDQKYATNSSPKLGKTDSGGQMTPDWIQDKLNDYFDPAKQGLSDTDKAHLETLQEHYSNIGESVGVGGASVSSHVRVINGNWTISDITVNEAGSVGQTTAELGSRVRVK
ncbi:MAG: hypothetical protein LBI84_10535 [Propionibacteriaceae bacterium]|jgi:hypothetical protein|nr:hypothetical protein [Propionibacteriaceae bacterium]